MNTMMVLCKYPEYLQGRLHFSLEENHFIDYSRANRSSYSADLCVKRTAFQCQDGIWYILEVEWIDCVLRGDIGAENITGNT